MNKGHKMKNRGSNIDIGKLMEEVQRYPFVYQLSHVDYKDNGKKNNAWMQVTKVLFPNETAESLNKKCVEVRALFYQLKASYKKSLTACTPSGSAAKKPYKYAGCMEFLLDSLEGRDTETNTPMDTQDS